MLHLKHLSPRAMNSLLTHSSYYYGRPIFPRSGREPPSSQYPRLVNPISLLCSSIKVIERLLLPALEGSLRLADSQHGLRKMRSTTSALLPLAQKVIVEFNQNIPPLRTVAMAIDFSKDFDTRNHTKLLEAISSTSLHYNIIRWLSAYLRGRIAS